MTKGRKVPVIQEYEFSNGQRAKLYRVSPFLAAEIAKKFPPPEPPIQEVPLPDGTIGYDANPSHPDYAKALKDHQEEIQKRMWRLMIDRGVDIDVDQEELDDIRAYMRKEQDTPLPEDENDKVAYMKYVCLCTEQEIATMVGIVLRGSMPTEEAIQEEVRTFQGDVSGS